MRIYYVCQRVPYPPDRGDKIITFNEIRHLGRNHEVHVFCLADGRDDLANTAGLADVVASVTAVPVARWFSRLRGLAALVAGTPLSVAMLREASLLTAIRRAASRLAPDLVFVFSSNVAQFAEPFDDVPRIMHFADLDSQKWRAFAARSGPPLRWLYALESRRLLAYERRIARSFSHSLVCTDAEAEDFRALIPGAPVGVARNGVDLDYFRPLNLPKRPGSLVFTGVMDYWPNVDAVCWFCEAILPLVRRAVPAATLTICGSRPSALVRRLAQLPGVTVTGRVPDVRPYLDGSEVFVAPLRLARGVQNKLLEAMAMGLPVVATATAWRGIGLQADNGVVSEEDPGAFAAAVVRLLEDSAHRAEMGVQARAMVETCHAWPVQLMTLDHVIADVLNRDTESLRSPVGSCNDIA